MRNPLDYTAVRFLTVALGVTLVLVFITFLISVVAPTVLEDYFVAVLMFNGVLGHAGAAAFVAWIFK